MDRRLELLLTWLLAGSCLLAAAGQLTGRLAPRFVPLQVERPRLQVSISGAVTQPGSYTLDWGATVADLLELAGGLTMEAATELVQFGRPLGQGDTISVPRVQAADGGQRVSINNADSWTLQRLPGVGPALAGRIIQGRPYHTVEQLLNVSGIGPATFARLEPLITP